MITDPVSNSLHEVLYEAELAFTKATTYREQYEAAHAWLSVADLLQERGEMDAYL